MSTPPPGWYPDPAMAQTQRYWDGRTWTTAVAPLAPAPTAMSEDELKWLLPVGRSGASIAASYVGIAAVVFSFLGFFGLALGLTSLGLGIWARTLSRKGKGGGGRAIFAIVAGIFAIVVGSLTALMYLQGPS